MAEEIRVDYTTKDYHGYREDMVELIPSKMPEWTDRSPNDTGIVILELLAYELEKQSYYNDRVANEVFLSTATQRKSVIEHCKKIGYELAWQTPAKHFQVFEIVPQVEPSIIPKGTLVGTKGSSGEEPVIFETVEDLIIPSGETGLEKDEDDYYKYMVEVEHGQTISDEFLGTVVTNEGHQGFQLAYSPVLKGTIKVDVQDNTGKRGWTMVDDFISSRQLDEHYIIEVDEYDRVKAEFGTGSSGKIPDTGSSIYASYKVGGGTDGNVGSNSITECFVALDGFVSTFNPFGPHILGKEKESLEEAKWKGPASLKRLDRYVTLDDYETGVLMDVEGIAKTKAINNSGKIDLYVLPQGSAVPSQGLKDHIMSVVEKKKVIFTIVEVKNPTYMDFNLSINLTIYNNFDANMIKYEAENLLRDMFDIDNVNFGGAVKHGEIYHTLFKIKGVENATITQPVGDMYATTETTIPRLINLEVLINGR